MQNWLWLYVWLLLRLVGALRSDVCLLPYVHIFMRGFLFPSEYLWSVFVEDYATCYKINFL